MESIVFSFYTQRAGIKPLRSTDASNVTLLSFVSSYFPAVKTCLIFFSEDIMNMKVYI
jgi:hypothetical protein